MMEAFDLYSPEIDADPFPYYEVLRDQAKVENYYAQKVLDSNAVAQ